MGGAVKRKKLTNKLSSSENALFGLTLPDDEKFLDENVQIQTISNEKTIELWFTERKQHKSEGSDIDSINESINESSDEIEEEEGKKNDDAGRKIEEEKKEQETQIMDIDKDTRKGMIKFLSESHRAYHGKEDSDNKVIADFTTKFNIPNMVSAIKIIERIEQVMDIDEDTRKGMIKFLSESHRAYHGKED